MLELSHIQKSYTTGSFTQVALADVSVAFRDNEFVSILGQSGSGKTTLLNVIGGLDHFDGGDLVIDGISTREYKDRDWDAYRNNRIGFVFQSYNLIPHQTILANVELALTLSGVSPAERSARAREALSRVGLAEHVDKRPYQLSGGQMQRVAIARALINDPEILLADEPTGALDSKTSVQVMDLLREVAEDRLVIMVTHNPELAERYSTRIVELADGVIRSDTDPFDPSEADQRAAKAPRMTSMSFLTALSLSFNNLMTKKGRTLMTAFAGSIGIIGIAAILALANGVNAYIAETEEETLSVYPLQIMSSGLDMTSMFVDVQGEIDTAKERRDDTTVVHESRTITSALSSVGQNDLTSLKAYLDEGGGGIDAHVQDIEYLYGIVPHIYRLEDSGKARQVNPDTTFASLGFSSSSMMMQNSMFSQDVFAPMPADTGLFSEQYDVLVGSWPSSYDEVVLVLSRLGTTTDFISYAMGLRDAAELEEMVEAFADQRDFEAPTDERDYSLDELMDVTFYVVPVADLYVHDAEFGVWTNKADDDAFVAGLVSGAQELRVSGIVQPKEGVDATTLSQGIYYTPALTDWLIERAASSEIVQQQLASPDTNVISGKTFEAEAAEEQSGDLDFSSLISIDESKIAGAFTIDANALDLSGLSLTDLLKNMDLAALVSDLNLDLSAVTIPSLDLGSIQAAPIDASTFALDLTGIDLTGIRPEDVLTDDVRDALAAALIFDPTSVFEGVDLADSVDTSRVAATIAEVQEGLPAYMAAYVQEHPEALADQAALVSAVSGYYASPEVTAKLLEGMMGAVSISQPNLDRITENLHARTAGLAALSPDLMDRLSDAQVLLVSRVTEAVGVQLAGIYARLLATDISQSYAGQVSHALSTALAQLTGSLMGVAFSGLETAIEGAVQRQLAGAMQQMMASMAGAIHVDEQQFAEAFAFNMTEEELAELMSALMSTERTTYESNLTKLGYADTDTPTEIDIYPKSFEDKEEVVAILDAYNDEAREAGDEDRVITYTDLVGTLMTSVTSIVDMISYVLIAFVAISLVVSSIMIGVITYISVLERKKEIGILRSIGASKRDVSRVFNAETVIEGLVSGLMGVTITFLITIPANIIVETSLGVERVARLPLGAAAILVGVSVVLSFVAGLVPARGAAKADPVEALRSE